MRTNQVNANHVELIGTCKGNEYSYKAVFSYGRCAVIRCEKGNRYFINEDVYKYSTSTSRHINGTFPELRKLNLDKLPENVIMIADDSRMDAVFCDVLGV